MGLSNEQVRQFQALYLEHLGKKIDYETAEAEAIKLISLVRLTQPKEMEIGMENKASDCRASSGHALAGKGNGTKTPRRA